MCIIGGQLTGKSGSLILVNFTNLVNLGFQYFVVGLPHKILQLLVSGSHLPAGAVTHSPCAGSQLDFQQSLPCAPTGVSEFARWRRDDDSQKPPWQRETSQPWSAQAVQGCAAQVGWHAKGTRGCDALSTAQVKSTA